MKISLAKSAGFCFGVKRAIDIAYRTLAGNKKVCMLGDIVHNEEVAARLEKAGIKKSVKLNKGKNKIFLIRAHGAGLQIIAKARRLGYQIVDATCPMVKEIHKIARSAERSGYTVIVIGDKKHDEVQGIIGQLKERAIVIEAAEKIAWGKLHKIKKACVVVQSTQNLEKVMRIVSLLETQIRDLKFFNTICRPTRVKQEEMKNIPLENDLMIIIGSKTSANTQRLYEIAKSLNAKSYWVQSKKDIKPAWLKGVKKVGITAGASTPDDTTREVIAYLKSIS
ncbi:MAG: 4-hydroxy-3-methylbut-2-enyl diphosphate reductase [Candidatus Omnitrophota bacterium]|jgi:4-hydroxy-3-methylbut-2-enyl diphosphate reductase